MPIDIPFGKINTMYKDIKHTRPRPLGDRELDQQLESLEAMRQGTIKMIERIEKWQKCYGECEGIASIGGKMTNHEALGDTFNALGQRVTNPGYARILLCGTEIERKLGAAQRKLHKDVGDHVLLPMKTFLRDDVPDVERSAKNFERVQQDMEKIASYCRDRFAPDLPHDLAWLPDRELLACKERAPFADPSKADAWDRLKNAVDLYVAERKDFRERLNRINDYQKHHQQLITAMFRLWREYLQTGVQTTRQFLQEAKNNRREDQQKSRQESVLPSDMG